MHAGLSEEPVEKKYCALQLRSSLARVSTLEWFSFEHCFSFIASFSGVVSNFIDACILILQ